MDSIHNAMKRIIDKCDVCIDGNIISKELLIRTFADYISATIEEKHHNIGVVLHTGSICFDAILLAYAAISNILYNETNPTSLIHSLQVGDLVLCYDGSKGKTKPSKWVFEGFVNSTDETPKEIPGTYVVLQNEKRDAAIYLKEVGAKLSRTMEHQNQWTVEGFGRKTASGMTFSGRFWKCRIQKFPAP